MLLYVDETANATNKTIKKKKLVYLAETPPQGMNKRQPDDDDVIETKAAKRVLPQGFFDQEKKSELDEQWEQFQNEISHINSSVSKGGNSPSISSKYDQIIDSRNGIIEAEPVLIEKQEVQDSKEEQDEKNDLQDEIQESLLEEFDVQKMLYERVEGLKMLRKQKLEKQKQVEQESRKADEEATEENSNDDEEAGEEDDDIWRK